MPKKALAVAAIAFLCISHMAAEAPVASLADAIMSAKENNLDIEYARATLERTMRIQDNAMSTFMPSISLKASASPSVSFPVSSAEEIRYGGLAVSAGADASFEFKGEMANDGKVRSLAKEAASLEFRAACDEVESAVISAYWNMAALSAEHDSALAAMHLAEEQYSSALAGYERGMIGELSMRQSEYSLSTARLTLSAAEDSLRLAMEQLKALTGLSGDFRTMPLPDPVMLSLPSAEELFEEYSAGTLAMQQARNALESERSGRDSAVLSAYVPRLSASIGYSYGGLADGSWNYTHRTNSLTGSVSLSIPLSQMLPGGTADSAIRDRDDSIRLASIALSRASENLLEEIRSGVIRISQLQDSIGSAISSEEIAERTYQLTQEAYEAGASSALDLADARTALLQSQMTTISYRVSHLLECYALSDTLGIDISELQAGYSTGEKEDR